MMGKFLFLSGLVVYYTNTTLPLNVADRKHSSLRQRAEDRHVNLSSNIPVFSLFVKDFEDLIIPDYKLALTDLTRCELFYLTYSSSYKLKYSKMCDLVQRVPPVRYSSAPGTPFDGGK